MSEKESDVGGGRAGGGLKNGVKRAGSFFFSYTSTPRRPVHAIPFIMSRRLQYLIVLEKERIKERRKKSFSFNSRFTGRSRQGNSRGLSHSA